MLFNQLLAAIFALPFSIVSSSHSLKPEISIKLASHVPAALRTVPCASAAASAPYCSVGEFSAQGRIAAVSPKLSYGLFPQTPRQEPTTAEMYGLEILLDTPANCLLLINMLYRFIAVVVLQSTNGTPYARRWTTEADRNHAARNCAITEPLASTSGL
jgi:hypothetical protein